jgi:hypothetical protein
MTSSAAASVIVLALGAGFLAAALGSAALKVILALGGIERRCGIYFWFADRRLELED